MKKENEKIKQRYQLIKSRQLFAIIVTLSFIVILAVASKRPDLLGGMSKGTALGMQILVMVAFLNFSAWNWRCPSCKKYLGHDINIGSCRKCKSLLR